MVQDLNEALIFAKVVEKGSFTGAAAHLAIPKTTVSRKVRDLERRLGVRLLNRTTRQLSLTEAGTVYFDYSSRIARELDAAEDAVLRLEERPRGWLRVTAPYTLCPELLSVVVRDFRELYPEVHVELLLANERLDLVANQIDVALRVGPLPDSSLVARTISRYRSYVYASESYIARHGEPREPAELADHHALTKQAHRRGNRHVWQLRKDGRVEEAIVNPVVIANDPFALRMLLVGGQGLMLTSELITRVDEQQGLVRRVMDGWSGPETEVSAVFPGGRLTSPKVRTFVDFVAERLRAASLTCLPAVAEAIPLEDPAA